MDFFLWITFFAVGCTPQGEGNKWQHAVEQLVEKNRKINQSNQLVQFIGSSTIRRWHSLQRDMLPFIAINNGFGGAQLSDVASFFDLLTNQFPPQAIVIYAGENDLRHGSQTPKQVLQSFKSIYTLFRQKFPSKILFYVAIKPTYSHDSKQGKLQHHTNQLIRHFIENSANAEFIDVYHGMLTSNGEPKSAFYLADGIHLTQSG